MMMMMIKQFKRGGGVLRLVIDSLELDLSPSTPFSGIEEQGVMQCFEGGSY